MDEKNLPDKIIDLEVLRIKRNIDKNCKCLRRDRRFTIDSTNRKVYCDLCKSEVDAYDAILNLAENRERLVDENKRLLDQRQQIVNYKPWLLVFRDLERQYRGQKDMLPACPHCGRGFYFEEIRTWVNKKLENLRRDKEKE